MSNQFYNYIAKLITRYIEKNGSSGERYYIQLDTQLEVSQLVKAIARNPNRQEFRYKHKHGEPYETFAIHSGNHKLIVASTFSEVKPDFLVTLRNLVGEQIEEFKNSSLLSIVSEQLDSIEGGSSNLQKEGMPLHPNSIFENLDREIDNSILSAIDKVILKNNLEYLLSGDPFQQVTIFDFKSIFSTLDKGSIDEDKLSEFGLFKDSDITTFPKKKQEERLRDNRELFDYVKRVHDYGAGKEELEERFSDEGAKQLIKEYWFNTSYSLVNKYREDFIKQNKEVKITYEEIRIKHSLIYWDKPFKEKTAAGRRKRHIIIFNPEKLEKIELNISFMLSGNVSSLERQYLVNGKQNGDHLTVDPKRKNLQVKVNTMGKDSVYVNFTYKHNNRVALGAEFYIAVLSIDPSYIEKYKTQYVVNVKRRAVELKYDGDELVFGSGIDQEELDLEKNSQQVQMTEIGQLTLRAQPEAFDDNDELMFYINIQKREVRFLLTTDLPQSTPISGQRIRKVIREEQKTIEWIRENNRLIIGNIEYYFTPDYAQFFEWEDSIIKNRIKYAKYKADLLDNEGISLSLKMREAYNRLITYFYDLETIPSLSLVTDELKERAIAYIDQYINEVQLFDDGLPIGKKGIDLFKLGTIKGKERIYLTPLHPLMLAYRVKYFEQLGDERLNNNILDRLTPEALLPFIYDENEDLYKPEYRQSVPEWLEFKPVNKISVTDANQYLARIVKDKIVQFQTHFGYLFMEKSKAPFKISIVNISNDLEVVKGILVWMIDSLDYKTNTVCPVEITLYRSGNEESALDKFSTIESAADFTSVFNLKFGKHDIDDEDVLRILRENISFYKSRHDKSYRYAHITFYKMEEQGDAAIQAMKNMPTGIAIDGLYSSIPSMKDEEDVYRSGFGVKSYNNSNNILTKVAYYTNELAANLGSRGNDSYRKGQAIYPWTKNKDESVLQEILDTSHWVTLVDPSIDLDFFNKFDDNLVVIHYSDQYSSSSRYDAITVTNKSDQYYSVIKEFLEQKQVEGNINNVRNTVKAFNMFNGEWLLRIIGSKGHSSKEKLSIISAIKYIVSYLDHPNILWVPISLEEVLRVAGAVGLSQSDGVFTAKNLGVKGAHSDDLLLIGLEHRSEEVQLHLYPVEVKIGINTNAVIDKGKIQVNKTKRILLDSLTGETGETFKGRFYRDFFVQLFIANAKVLDSNKFWEVKGYNLNDDIIERLIKDEYQISNRLMPYIGVGAVLSFRKDAIHRSAGVENDILLVDLAEDDGFNGLVLPIGDLREWVQKKSKDLIKETMLSRTYQPADHELQELEHGGNVTTGEDTEEYVKRKKNDQRSVERENDESKQNLNGKDTGLSEVAATIFPEEKETPKASSEETTDAFSEVKEVPLEEARFLLGTIDNSNHEVYWEYGHKELANRHLLISGKSGQGKTYFMQCLLLEASRQGIPNIVIDYTEGFLPNQLEEEFTETLGDKINHQIVYNEKFHINPFMKNMRDIGGIQLLETETDVAERIRSVFSAVYNKLGIQQLNAIYDATYNGLEQYGNQMSLIKLREILEEDSSSYAKTALSQIRPLIDRNPFDIHDIIDWKDIIDSDGEVFIIQLTGFNREVQLVITEFILWDLWNYSIRNGDKNLPIPVIMDEAQNLDHREKSPSARILTEGRKFGWSAWYATQFLKAQLDADELARLQNSSQKIYFSPPEEEISNIASSLSRDVQERKEWERKLARLKKGQCIAHGPVLHPNGELSTPTINVINITPLEDRI